jgi:large subunit ribosomal protein L21
MSEKTTTKKTTKVAKKETVKPVKKVPAKKAAPKATKKTATKEVKKTPAKKTAVKDETLKFAEAKNSENFAFINIAGTQLKVVEGLKYEMKKIEGEKGDVFDNTEVLLLAKGSDVKVGKPFVEGAKVTLEIDSQKKAEKQRIFKYKAKARYRRTYGSREMITRVLVKKIEG